MLMSFSVSTRPSQRCRSNSTWATFKRYETDLQCDHSYDTRRHTLTPGYGPTTCRTETSSLHLSCFQSLAFILTLISAFHTNNHPDTCLTQRSFSCWNILTFNLLCPAGNLSHTCPDFFHSKSRLDVANAYFQRLQFLWQETCVCVWRGESLQQFNQGVSSLRWSKTQ